MGPSDARLVRQDEAAGTAGQGKLASHLRRPPPATAPRPASGDAWSDAPRQRGRDAWTI